MRGRCSAVGHSAATHASRTIPDAVDELHRHIAKEEDGLFPVSLTALTGDDWNRAMAAWRDAHPDVRTP